MVRLILMAIVFTGCAGLEQVDSTKALGGGVGAGVVATKAVEKVKAVFTPEYPLLFEPVEICGLDQPDEVQCFLVPCQAEDSKCSYTEDKQSWIAKNPKVITVRSSMLIKAKHFCQKHREACEKYHGLYQGNKIAVSYTHLTLPTTPYV